MFFPAVRNYFPVWRELKPECSCLSQRSTFSLFGTTFPFEGNWNINLHERTWFLIRSELLSRLKGIETRYRSLVTWCHSWFGTTFPFEGNWNFVISLKNIALSCLVRNYFPVWRELKHRWTTTQPYGVNRSELLSRLKGIETATKHLWESSTGWSVRNYFPVWRELKLCSYWSGSSAICRSELLSRLKGIETYQRRLFREN